MRRSNSIWEPVRGEMFTWLISTCIEVLEITFDKEHYLQEILQDIALHQF